MTNFTPVYTYYREIRSEAHLLFSSEIARLLYKSGWAANGKIPIKFCEIYLKVKTEELNIEPLYYYGRHGLKKVWPEEIQMALVYDIYQKNSFEIVNKGKTYRIIRII